MDKDKNKISVTLDGIRFFSNFDSGNLARVEKVTKKSDPLKKSYEYNLWNSHDAAGTPYVNNNRTWFYFGVRGVEQGAKIKFNIVNMNKQKKLYAAGYTPLYRVTVSKKKSASADSNEPSSASSFKDPSQTNNNECHKLINNFDINNDFITEDLDDDDDDYDDENDDDECDIEPNDSDNTNESNNRISRKSASNKKSDSQKVDFSTDNLKWNRVKDKVFFTTEDNSNHILSFSHTFNIDHRLKQVTTFFAFAYPWTYGQNKRKLSILDSLYQSKDKKDLKKIPKEAIYYHRELLCHSIDRNRVDLITVSDHHYIRQEREERFDPLLFPDVSSQRCHAFNNNKKVFFVSSRVHPGETPAGHVFNGILDFLLDKDDSRAKQLRKKFVFKLVPMLNPDGVYRGHYRTDQYGQNLNRFYLNPDPQLQPSIYAVKCLLAFHHCGADVFKNLMKNVDTQKEDSKGLSKEKEFRNFFDDVQSIGKSNNETSNMKSKHYNLSHPSFLSIPPEQSGVAFYVDLHAHSSKKGFFFYGNYFDNEKHQVETHAFAKLVSINNGHFDLSACNFNQSNMYSVDKTDKLSKEGSGRVAIYKHLGLVHCYTLECNYNTGRFVKAIPSLNSHAETTSTILLPQKYTTQHFEEVGQAVLIAALDFVQCNPLSRLQRSEFVNLENLFEHIKKVRVYSSYSQEITRKKKESDTAKKELVKEASQSSVKKSSKSIPQKSKRSSLPKSESKTSVKIPNTQKSTPKPGQTKSSTKLINSIQSNKEQSDNALNTEPKVVLKAIFNEKLKKEPTPQRFTKTASKSTRRYSLLKGEPSNDEEIVREKYIKHTTRRHSNPAVYRDFHSLFHNSEREDKN